MALGNHSTTLIRRLVMFSKSENNSFSDQVASFLAYDFSELSGQAALSCELLFPLRCP